MDDVFGMENFFGDVSAPRKKAPRKRKTSAQTIVYVGGAPRKRRTTRRTYKQPTTRSVGFGDILAGAKAVGRGAAVTYDEGKTLYKRRKIKKFLGTRTTKEIRDYKAKGKWAKRYLRKEKMKRGVIPEEEKLGFFKRKK